MGKKVDLTGRVFGRLTVIEEAGRDTGGRTMLLCRCECGNTKEVRSSSITGGNTKSCGCLQKEFAAMGQSGKTHGMVNAPIYRVWNGMKSRCYCQSNIGFADYGGRGITVCDRWLNSFENFYADMGDIPEGMSIDRKDNNLGYNPENCRWATDVEQNQNKRNNRLLTHNGKTMCIAEWAEYLGISRNVIDMRLREGWTDERTLTAPIQRKSK